MAFLGVLTHRKTRRLVKALGVPQYAALGILEALWHVTSEQARDGGIGRMSNKDIAEELYWDGEPDALIDALVSSGWLDEVDGCRLYVHDWEIHSTDTVDVFLARGGKYYANGAQPRMTRMSKEERAKLIARHGYSCEVVRTENHDEALPEPEPKPEPIINKKEREIAGEEIETGTEPPPGHFEGMGRWRPPTQLEVLEFLESLHGKVDGLGDEAARFCSHYGSTNWKIRGSLIENWREKAKTWKLQEPKSMSTNSGGSARTAGQNQGHNRATAQVQHQPGYERDEDRIYRNDDDFMVKFVNGVEVLCDENFKAVEVPVPMYGQGSVHGLYPPKAVVNDSGKVPA